METPKKTDSGYELKPDGRFVIRDYNRKKPFANFLPGIAGLYGIPMWVFTVNRGQGVASFGTRNKDNAILEFFPANKAYQHAPVQGFRTFLKLRRKGKTHRWEPFREAPAGEAGPAQEMEVSSHELVVRETNASLGLGVEVRYFTVPGEPLAALAREVTFTNRGYDALDVEALDGLPQVNPYGMNEFFVKHMSRTIEAWMVVENANRRAPFFRLKVDATDRPEVVVIREGNFFFGLDESKAAEAVVDPALVFGSRLDFGEAKAFYESEPFRVPARQSADNKTPCAFTHVAFKLAPGRSHTVRSFFGQACDVELVNRYAAKARRAGYLDAKRRENRALIDAVKGRIFTVSSSSAYDLYCGQTYLDNVMRGGLPVVAEGPEADFLFYAYSRKHGDLERDYNRFLVENTMFSQGDGNYRDVNQNRRNDVWFEPRVRDTNIRTFFSFLQLDGYNPLVIKGAQFRLSAGAAAKKALSKALGPRPAAAAFKFMQRPFHPGSLFRFLESGGFATRASFEKALGAIAPHVTREDQAEHGEGFWTDHWTYNLDLVESYLAVYPEDETDLVFGRADYTFFDNDHFVRPRREKHLLTPAGARQFQSVGRDKKKAELIASRERLAHCARTRSGKGDVYRTTLFVKMACLFANKFATLDPQGMGVEMEADKPSWYDALNGLPGLFGSSLCESFELKRLAVFMIHAIDEAAPSGGEVSLPAELHAFLESLERALARRRPGADERRNFEFWDETAAAKERYREAVFWGVSGREKRMPLTRLKSFLEHAREKIEVGLDRAFDAKARLHPTYFAHEAVRFVPEKRSGGPTRLKVTDFRSKALPHFLEGPVHALKTEQDPARRRSLVQAVRQSPLYDAKLGMYKVNAPLESASLEIGRARVFAPGWLENESIWLHMEYKFMLEILKAGLAEDFFKDFKKALVAFQPPARYGRSVLENSSFIASSAFQDPALHGTGFVARLSGSTAEFLSMWLLMNVGKRPFLLGPDGKLSLRFQPTLPAWLFTERDTEREYTDPDGAVTAVRVPRDSYAFLFLGKTLVVYHNPRRLDTFGTPRASVKKITVRSRQGSAVEFRGDTVPSPYAARVRDERVARIDVELG